MRKFYQTILLSGVALSLVAGAAMAADAVAKETHLGKAYDKVVAAGTAVSAKNEKEAIKSLKSAKWDFRKNDFMNKDKEQVAKDKEILTQINAVVATLKSEDADKLAKAAPEIQKIQDQVQIELKEEAAAATAAAAEAAKATPASATAPEKAPEAPKAH